jgi:hypothetical protein
MSSRLVWVSPRYKEGCCLKKLKTKENNSIAKDQTILFKHGQKTWKDNSQRCISGQKVNEKWSASSIIREIQIKIIIKYQLTPVKNG